MKCLVASALLFAACDGASGTIALSLATAPGSDLLASIDKLRVTTNNPRSVTEETRGADGIDLAIEFEATDVPGTIFVEGFDSAGMLIATGQSAPFTLGGGDANLVIYVAEPYSINEAPVHLVTGRSNLAASQIVYGAVVAGGLDASNGVSDAISIYNVYSHSLQEGAAMPGRRYGQSICANVNGGVYLFGGRGENGLPTSSLYEFISTTAPAGAYINAGDQSGFERAEQVALQIGPDSFVITGSPAMSISLGAVGARGDLPALSAQGASFPGAARGQSGTAAAVRDDGLALVTFDDELVLERDIPHTGSVAALSDGTFVVIGGTDVIHVADEVTVKSPLSIPRIEPTVAATSHFIVVAGGMDGSFTPIPSADILDASTFGLVTTVPLLPRMHTQAVAMANEQIMLVGGDTASDVIELFTPPVVTE